ncbi:MAG: hypothetical protein M1469_04620 [Bacteroidetes bacterium]|nr:hypothetical protein [Bacteroidota bacterium]
MKEIEFALSNKKSFLEYFHSKFPSFHLSNVFYRDLRYALKYYLNSNKFSPSDAELEAVLRALIKEMVTDGILKPVSDGVWTLNYSDYRTKTPGKPVFKEQ